MFSQPTNPFGYLAGVFDPKLRRITGCPPPKLGGKMMTGAEDEVAAFTHELKKAGRRQRLMVTLDVHRALSVAALAFEDHLALAAALLAFNRTMTWAEVNLPSTPLPEEMLEPKPEGGRWCWLTALELITRQGAPHLHPHILALLKFYREGEKCTIRTSTLWQAAPLIGGILREELRRICNAHGFDLNGELQRKWVNVFTLAPVDDTPAKVIWPLSELKKNWAATVSRAALPPLPRFQPCPVLPPPLSRDEVNVIADKLGWFPFSEQEQSALRRLAAKNAAFVPYLGNHVNVEPASGPAVIPDTDDLLPGQKSTVCVDGPKDGPRARFVNELFPQIELEDFVPRLTAGRKTVYVEEPVVVNPKDLGLVNGAIRAQLKQTGFLTFPKNIEVVGDYVEPADFCGGFVIPRVRQKSGWFQGQPQKMSQVPVDVSPDRFEFFSATNLEVAVGDVVVFPRKIRLRRGTQKKRWDAFTPFRVVAVEGSVLRNFEGWCAPAEFARHAYALEAETEHELRPRLCVPGNELEKSIGRLFHDHVFGEGAPWLWLRKATDPQPDWTAIFEQRKLLVGGKATWAELVALTLRAGRPKPSAAVVGIACFQVALTTGHDVRNLITAELAAEVATLPAQEAAEHLVNACKVPAAAPLFLPPKLLERLSAKQAEIIEPEIKI
jgi:hypothetical protein